MSPATATPTELSAKLVELLKLRAATKEAFCEKMHAAIRGLTPAELIDVTNELVGSFFQERIREWSADVQLELLHALHASAFDRLRNHLEAGGRLL